MVLLESITRSILSGQSTGTQGNWDGIHMVFMVSFCCFLCFRVTHLPFIKKKLKGYFFISISNELILIFGIHVYLDHIGYHYRTFFSVRVCICSNLITTDYSFLDGRFFWFTVLLFASIAAFPRLLNNYAFNSRIGRRHC